MESPRKFLHVDMDAFYASVEQLDDPALRGRPVIVGGRPGGRGVVAAASYEARRFGVRSAMPTGRALRLCPEAVVMPPRFERYRELSGRLRAILDEHADEVEPLSLDEAYLDVTEDKACLGSATAAAERIRARVREELSLTCSAGVAPLKFVAKIASGHRKPDGLTVVAPGRVLAFIHPLPIERLWGVGPATAAAITARLEVRTIGELAALDPSRVVAALGPRGRALWGMAHGEDPRRVAPSRPRRSHGAERTFPEDVEDSGLLAERVRGLAERVCADLSAAPRTVTVKVRYADFTTVTRSATLEEPTADARVVADVAVSLLERTEVGQRPVRLAGVSLSGFPGAADPSAQLALPLDRFG
jgi:DNA polymerase-4